MTIGYAWVGLSQDMMSVWSRATQYASARVRNQKRGGRWNTSRDMCISDRVQTADKRTNGEFWLVHGPGLDSARCLWCGYGLWCVMRMTQTDSSDVCTQYSYDKDVPARTLKRRMAASDMTTGPRRKENWPELGYTLGSAEYIGAGIGLRESTASPEWSTSKHSVPLAVWDLP